MIMRASSVIAVVRLLEFDGIDGLESFVPGDDDLLARFETIQYFHKFGIAAAEPDRAPHGRTAIRRKYENPVAGGVLVERTVGQHHRARGPTELDLQVDRFARVHAGRRRPVEIEIDLERAVGD